MKPHKFTTKKLHHQIYGCVYFQLLCAIVSHVKFTREPCKERPRKQCKFGSCCLKFSFLNSYLFSKHLTLRSHNLSKFFFLNYFITSSFYLMIFWFFFLLLNSSSAQYKQIACWKVPPSECPSLSVHPVYLFGIFLVEGTFFRLFLSTPIFNNN
jgi:hypothetical protein